MDVLEEPISSEIQELAKQAELKLIPKKSKDAYLCIRATTNSYNMADMIVEVEQGKLHGKSGCNYKGGKYYSFQGIPYAKPPVGELRFKAPLPPEQWQGIRDATVEASECYARNPFLQNKFVGSEDCLFLNVYAPELPDVKKTPLKPVLFYIHGGAFIMGSSKTDIHGPEILMTGDVVLITINYRLGILGFLKVEDPVSGVTGNAAFKDMVMALEWVQRNIKEFGGDPNNVTIFGVSAGSASVHCLVLSPMAKGLFHRAILQSGCALNPWILGEQSTTSVSKFLGYESKDESDILPYLQSLPVEKILDVQDQLKDNFRCNKIRPFAVTVEKSSVEPMFFPDHPLNILKSGNYNKVPLMFGYTSSEGLIIEMELFSALKHFDNDFETKIPYYLNVPKGIELSLTLAKKIKEGYYGSCTPSAENIENLCNLETDILFLRGIHKSIKLHVKMSDCPVYFYRFSVEADRNLLKKLINKEIKGTAHGDDIGYLFWSTYLEECKENSLEDLVIQRMVKLWTTFARNGNPNAVVKDTLVDVTWEPVKLDCYRCLDIGNELKCIENPESDRMKIWDEIASIVAKSKN